MRIYIDDYDVSKLKTKLNNLAENIAKCDTRLYLLSEDGMFYTTNEDIFKVLVEKEDDLIYINNYINNINIVVDNSIEIHNKVYSLPYDHVQFNTVTLTVTLNTCCNVKLVLVGKPKVPSPCQFFKKHTTLKYDYIDIINFYFDTPITDIANDDLKKSIIMFLSLLN